MIQSKGNNQFKDNKFDFWTWSAPILQTQEEVVAAVHELKLIGRTIKDIQAVGQGYDLRYDYFHDIIEAIYNGDDKALESMDFPCSIEIDDPLLIMFNDGDILGIDYSEGSSIRMEMNTLPWGIRRGIASRNFHANRLFRDILGSRIDDIIIASSINQPSFTGSYGMALEDQSSYLNGFSLICHGAGPGFEAAVPMEFTFEAMFDYGCVSLNRQSSPVTLPAARLREILDGYMSREDMSKYLELY